MRIMIRRLLMLLAAVLVTTCAAATTAGAQQPRADLDGVHVGHLPDGLGTASDFTYDYDDVAFVSRVLESRTDDGWRVDASVDVLRGARLTTGRALHDWFIAYEDRPAGEAQYVRVSVHGRPGWICADEIFWLIRPGLAVAVDLDTSRWPHSELSRIARSVRTDGSG